jgi:hypothetical protein
MMTWQAWLNDLSGLVVGQNEIQSCKPEIPSHNKQISEHLDELLNDSHSCYWGAASLQGVSRCYNARWESKRRWTASKGKIH